VKDQSLFYFFFASSLIHVAAIPLVSTLIPSSSLQLRQNLIPIDVIHVPRREEKREPVALPKPPPRRIEAKPPQPIPQQAPLKRDIPKAEDLEPKKNEPEKVAAPSSPPGGGDAQNTVSGAGNLFGSGDVAVVPGGGLGKSGTGRGEGAPGQGIGERGFRAAKPIQTAKASYPPMALRMGFEADVALKVLVDTEGKVVKAEIIKSAGMGFDEEALKAVGQFRFEPARRDGSNVASEFTYIYRFRLEK